MRLVHWIISIAALGAAPAAMAADATPAALVGIYEGGQMEIAAGLELSKDGRFSYILSYGALDEAAGGTWSADDKQVTLTIQQYESNDPGKGDSFGLSVLQIEGDSLVLPRHDRVLRFRKAGKAND